MRRINKNSVYVLLFLGIAAVFLWGYIELQKPVNTDVSMIKNVQKVNIEEIISMFRSNEQEANTTFIEKVIEVEGIVENISFLNNRHTILLKSDSFSKNFVMCDMSPLSKDNIKELSKGDTIVLKGVCKGFLLDVIMLNCMLIDGKTKE
ncbi:OB-fold protein [Maribacter sp. 2210JD10-5]|uniref:OB-fold protein n=1 Tax=Maribacter sp. 2210JD10-5 TaxID=3386272 RepID=UPI0039BD5A43